MQLDYILRLDESVLKKKKTKTKNSHCYSPPRHSLRTQINLLNTHYRVPIILQVFFEWYYFIRIISFLKNFKIILVINMFGTVFCFVFSFICLFVTQRGLSCLMKINRKTGYGESFFLGTVLELFCNGNNSGKMPVNTA